MAHHRRLCGPIRAFPARPEGPIRLAAAVLALALPSVDAPPAAPPPTEARSVTDVLHGKSIVDPYRWLEGDAKGAVTPEVTAWTDAQLTYTRQVLDVDAGRWLADEIQGKVSSIDWLPDSSGFFYRNLESVKDPHV